MTTYTVTDQNSGDVIDSGLSVIEAMDAILTDDGHEYEVRPAADGHGFELWTSLHSRNSTLGGRLIKSVVFSLADDREQATHEIAESVISRQWPRKPVAMTDEAHDTMMVEING